MQCPMIVVYEPNLDVYHAKEPQDGQRAIGQLMIPPPGEMDNTLGLMAATERANGRLQGKKEMNYVCVRMRERRRMLLHR